MTTELIVRDGRLDRQIRDARADLEHASIDSLIALRAWADAVTKAAKEKALRETALEASETRCRAERALGLKLRGGAGVALQLSDRGQLVKLAEIPEALFEQSLADMRRTRTGDQILGFRPDVVLRRASKLSQREVEPGIYVDYLGLYNTLPTVAAAREALRRDELEKRRWAAFSEAWNVRAERRKPENVRIDEAFTRARRLAQSVSTLCPEDPDARTHLAEAELLLAKAASCLHNALQFAVLSEGSAGPR